MKRSRDLLTVNKRTVMAILRIVLPYVVFAGLWIFLSDRLLDIMSHDTATHTQWSMYKGWAFVLVTALLLWVMLHAELGTRERALAAQRRSEEQLRESEIRYRTLFEHSLDAVLLTVPDGSIVSANQAACRMFGRTEQEICALGRNGIVDTGDPRLARLLEERDRTGSAFGEMTFIRSDGCRFSGEVSSVVFEDTSGAMRTSMIIRDITERKRSEAERRRLSDIIDKSLNEIYVFDAHTLTFRYANQGALRNLQYTLEEIKKLTPLDLKPDYTETDFRAKIRPLLVHELELIRFTTVHRRADGSLYPVEVHLQVMDADGDPVFVAVIFDSTEQKRTEEEQDKLRAQLLQAQKMESVGRLAGGVAHDFNNMLSVIVGHAEMALMKLDADHPLSSDLKEILKAAQRSAELTRQLLTFARKQPNEPRILDLKKTVAEMFSMLRRLIGEDIELSWKPGGNDCLVKIDPSQLTQILANLCVNARDAINGVGRVIIETATASFDAEYCSTHSGFMPGDYVQLTVSDNGCGMDRETVDRIFEPFFTTKEMGKGTGLGLSTVYGIVSQNNGFINVYSEPGRGTAFTICLPREKYRIFAPDDGAAAQFTGGNEAILLVEDEPAVLEIGRVLLESLGYRVLSTDKPLEAIRLAEEHGENIDLLITDVIMPKMNGRELARNLQFRYPSLVCLFMSGYTADVIGKQGVLEEGVHFIQKPFSPQGLAAKVREVLDGSRQKTE